MNRPDKQPTYVVITPVRNEHEHIEKTLLSMVSQSVLPVTWVVVDDDSSDTTSAIVERYASKHSFIQLVRLEGSDFNGGPDRLAWAAEAKAFNRGLKVIKNLEYDFLVKLDGDLSFEPGYFEKLLEEFKENPRLGIGGAHCYEMRDGEPKLEWVPSSHVRGATKIYRRECFEVIGGVEEILGWDTIDELRAQMKGWSTRSFAEPKLIHLRPTGSVTGVLRGKIRHGEASYILGYHYMFALVRAIRLMFVKPYVLGGLAYVIGFLKSFALRPKRLNDPELVQYLRRQQLDRILRPIKRAHGD